MRESCLREDFRGECPYLVEVPGPFKMHPDIEGMRTIWYECRSKPCQYELEVKIEQILQILEGR